MKNAPILVFNCGSSSIKFCIIDAISGDRELHGILQQIGSENANISWQADSAKKHTKQMPHVSYEKALDFIIDTIKSNKKIASKILAIGHRVVHGGEYFTKSAVIDEKVLKTIRDCQSLAPLHNPANILGIEAAQRAFPKLKQVATFDTAFHQTMPKHAYLYAIPYQLYAEHKIRKYGFHGTSHRYVSQKAAEILGKPIAECSFISAHLGNGCSVCAIAKGKSIDTSMELTPLAGLVMGTRSGNLDPGLHEHLANKLGYDLHKITNMLNKESGLLGISGIDSDMRAIEKAATHGNERAILAIEIFCYKLAQYIAAYIILLDQVDALIFTAGIGENSAYIREKTLSWLKPLNFYVDTEKNAIHGKNNDGIITPKNSKISLVIPTNEELIIAQDTVSAK